MFSAILKSPYCGNCFSRSQHQQLFIKRTKTARKKSMLKVANIIHDSELGEFLPEPSFPTQLFACLFVMLWITRIWITRLYHDQHRESCRDNEVDPKEPTQKSEV